MLFSFSISLINQGWRHWLLSKWWNRLPGGLWKGNSWSWMLTWPKRSRFPTRTFKIWPCHLLSLQPLMQETIISEVGFMAWQCSSMEDFEVYKPDWNSFNITDLPVLWFQAGLCDEATTNLMGEPVDPFKTGTFYLRTNSESPYAIPPANNL